VTRVLLLAFAVAGCGAPSVDAARPAPVRLAAVDPEPAVTSVPEPKPEPEPEPEPAEVVPEVPSAPAEPVLRVDLEPDEAFLARPRPAANTAAYRAWREKKKIQVGKTHLGHADLSPDGELLLVMSGMEATVRVYDAASGALVANHPIPGFGQFDRGTALFWPHADGEPAFVFGSERGLDLHAVRDGRVLARLSDIPAWDLVWSPDRRYLVSVSSEIPAQRSRVTFFRVLPDRRLEQVGSAALPQRVDGLDLSDDNRLLAYLTYPGDELVLHDLATGERRWAIPAPMYADGVDISPDGTLVAAGGAELVLVDAADPLRRSYATDFGNNIGVVRFSPSGDAVAASSYDGHVRLFPADLSKPKLRLLKDLRHAGTSNVYAVLFLADGAGLWSSSGDKTLRRFGR
jgi:WD40 repeat protein